MPYLALICITAVIVTLCGLVSALVNFDEDGERFGITLVGWPQDLHLHDVQIAIKTFPTQSTMFDMHMFKNSPTLHGHDGKPLRAAGTRGKKLKDFCDFIAFDFGFMFVVGEL